MSIAMLLEMAAEGMPERVAVGSRSAGLTYGQLLDRSRSVGAVVEGSGAKRVGLIAGNSEWVPVLLFAGSFAGAPFVPFNYRLADDRLRAVCSRIAPAITVADLDSVARLDQLPDIRVLTLEQLDQAAAATTPDSEGSVDPDEVALWLFTSGTTGEPKAAMLRHRHLVAYVLSTVEYMSADEDEATLVSVPPYHIAAMAGILTNIYAGRRIVYVAQFDPKEWVHLAEQEAVTHAMVVPTMLARILDVVAETGVRLPALRHLSYGGGRMPVPVIERAMRLLPQVGYVNAYGLTETSSTVAVLGPEEHRDALASDDPAVRARLGSVGRPFPSLELEIRSPDGRALARGETGEIFVRGDQIAGEYQGRSALTAEGWFATNDGGYLDADGFLFVEGRLDDVIVRGGENMSPGEIEDVLVQHPEVLEAAVVGLPDDEWGEVPAAAVVLEPGGSADESALQAWVRDRLRSSRTPVVIQVRHEMPYNEMGKLLRRVLRAELAEWAGGGAGGTS
jgi:acyl-CoA synthetase (AMP-forming)/AMP-acid ligase II